MTVICCVVATQNQAGTGILREFRFTLTIWSLGMNRGKSGIWLTASALGALLPLGQALAADLPVKATPIVAATFDWSGVYIGAHAGYAGA
jgi:hypothetical protein